MTVGAADEALKRLLIDGAAGGQAKVDAVVALSQRTLHVVTWPTTQDGFRTLVNSQGVAGLPVFTDAVELETAARRFGWVNPDGSLPMRELGAREAFSHAVAHNLFLIVNIAADHALEIEPAEIAPLLTPQARKDSTGPYATAGRISSTLLQAARPTPSSATPVQAVPATMAMPPTPAPSPPPPPPAPTGPAVPPPPPPNARTSSSTAAMPAARPPSTANAVAARAPSVAAMPAAQPRPSTGGMPPVAPPVPRTPPSGAMPAAAPTSFGGASGVTIARLSSAPTDNLMDALTEFLRAFPEVEWACIAAIARGPTAPTPTIGLRVDTGFRARLNEIMQGLRQKASDQGASLDVLLIDDPQLMRTARAEALMFYPWRK